MWICSLAIVTDVVPAARFGMHRILFVMSSPSLTPIGGAVWLVAYEMCGPSLLISPGAPPRSQHAFS
ncbi:hypothetical protein Arub01_59370 [Actinomadura rubrobrunea]|uniref:Uncharacterized protein n=1 Tax=Actinomadura rubrobrunea TaxID=115335 RepID=A0A9W6Q0G0_9ACTN|nr:hypothetical protein Arub01_59370 [Actinomadura rubrobrunea]